MTSYVFHQCLLGLALPLQCVPQRLTRCLQESRHGDTLTEIVSGSDDGKISNFRFEVIVITPDIKIATINKLAATEFLANHSIMTNSPDFEVYWVDLQAPEI